MDSDSLKVSIAQYEAQLLKVLKSIQSEEDSTKHADLINLKTDLEQLIKVSKDYLAELSEQTSNVDNVDPNDFDKEYATFMQEIAECDNTSQEAIADEIEHEKAYMKGLLDDIVGMKCIVSHTHNSGRKEKHLAMVCEIYASPNGENLENMRVKVMFTHPTSMKMLPCPYYLNGDCMYDGESCHYSHGEVVPLLNINDYDEPDYSAICVGSIVLVKQENKLWHKGTVSDIDNTTYTVTMEDKTDCVVESEDVVPIEQIITQDVEKLSNSDLSSDDEDIYPREIQLEKEIQDARMHNNTDLAGWEKHTKGIGSKLMVAMGYKMGTGLGSQRKGRVEPVPVQVLPARMSLDHCMRLREESGDDPNLFCMNKRLSEIKKYIKKKRANGETDAPRNKHPRVFSFINDMLSTTTNKIADKREYDAQTLKASSSKSLNLSSFRISENIKKTERDICKYGESLKRQKVNSFAYKEIQQKLASKKEELASLRTKDEAVTNEKQSRRDKTKLNIF